MVYSCDAFELESRGGMALIDRVFNWSRQVHMISRLVFLKWRTESKGDMSRVPYAFSGSRTSTHWYVLWYFRNAEQRAEETWLWSIMNSTGPKRSHMGLLLDAFEMASGLGGFRVEEVITLLPVIFSAGSWSREPSYRHDMALQVVWLPRQNIVDFEE